jgi:hypothetical protein
MSKTSYEGIKAGDTLILNTSEVHEGHLIERGTEFTVSCFPPKVSKRDRTDKNAKGYIREYFVVGTTASGKTVRTNLINTVRKPK